MGSVSDYRAQLGAVALSVGAGAAALVAMQPRTIGVAIGDARDWTAWRPDDRAVIASALVPLAATGDRWVMVPEGLADVVIRSYDSEGHCEHAGQWAVGSREIRVDYTCLHGDERLRYAVVHELLHYRRGDAMHVCAHASDGADCHPTITGERAVLRPAMPWEIAGDAYAPPPSSELTAADIAIVREH